MSHISHRLLRLLLVTTWYPKERRRILSKESVGDEDHQEGGSKEDPREG